MSQSLQYPQNEYGRDLERIDRELGERKVAGVVSEKFEDVKLRWSTGLEEEEVMANIDETLGLEHEALGARLKNDALVNYHDGVVQYSSNDGDISFLTEVMDASTEDEVYADRFVAGLLEQYHWLEN